jgi:hypothetical protein
MSLYISGSEMRQHAAHGQTFGLMKDLQHIEAIWAEYTYDTAYKNIVNSGQKCIYHSRGLCITLHG